MRFVTAVLAFLVSSQFASAAGTVHSVDCAANRLGTSLKIVWKPEIETTNLWYQVSLINSGKVYKTFEAFTTSAPQSPTLEIQGDDPENEGTIQYIEIDTVAKTAFVQSAANHGASPLPGASFSGCTIK